MKGVKEKFYKLTNNFYRNALLEEPLAKTLMFTVVITAIIVHLLSPYWKNATRANDAVNWLI